MRDRTLWHIPILPLPLTAVPAPAQETREIEPGETVSGEYGSTEKPDMYHFVYMNGGTVDAVLKVPGRASMTLFASSGETLKTEEGEGRIELQAVLPATDVFILSVAREDPETLYTLSLIGTEPAAPSLSESERQQMQVEEMLGDNEEGWQRIKAQADAAKNAQQAAQEEYEAKLKAFQDGVKAADAARQQYERDRAAHEAEVAKAQAARAQWEAEVGNE